MKGALYYAPEEASRNHGFIEDLQRAAGQIDWQLQLLTEPPEDDFDFVFFRDRNPSLSRRLEEQGYRLFNRSAVHETANDKLRTFELSTLLGTPAVPTVRADRRLPDYPLILKTRNGHGGSEVFYCANQEDAVGIFSRYTASDLIAQPFVESNATDIRVFMLGAEVLGAVKRTGKDSFKSNYTLGGSVERYTLDEAQTKQVRKIARALNSDYIGIDFLLTPDGWLLNEIEDPVGARSLYTTHDFSVAEKLIAYIQRQLEDEKISHQ